MRFVPLCSALFFMSGPALADGGANICRRGGDERIIEILTPGVVGAACDVRYSRESGSIVAVPYHADNDSSFCAGRARDLAALLTADGFDCSARDDEIERTLAGGPGATQSTAPNKTEIDSETLNAQLAALNAAGGSTAAPSAGPAANSPTPTLGSGVSETDGAVSPATAGGQISPTEELVLATPPIETTRASESQPGQDPVIANEKVQQAVEETPVNLTAGAKPSEFKAPLVKRSSASARIVGANPAVNEIQLAGDGGQEGAEKGDVASRTIEEKIFGVLSASAAAWNEGNLSAYLSYYAPTAGTTYIDGVDIATGMAQVRGRYEKAIAEAGAMGHLNYSQLVINATTESIATVVGRYIVTAGDKSITAGLMTLLMKEVDGRWRIVQDTRVRDPAVAQ